MSIKENENSFHCLRYFFPSLFFSMCFFFPLTITPATSYEAFWLHLAFISRHFLAAFKTQTVRVCVHWGGGGWTEPGATALCWHSRCWFGCTMVALFAPPSFFLSIDRVEQHRLKGIAEIKERVLAVFHIFWMVQWARPLLSDSTQVISRPLFLLYSRRIFLFLYMDKLDIWHHSK